MKNKYHSGNNAFIINLKEVFERTDSVFHI